jgi:hypothetical protein
MHWIRTFSHKKWIYFLFSFIGIIPFPSCLNFMIPYSAEQGGWGFGGGGGGGKRVFLMFVTKSFRNVRPGAAPLSCEMWQVQAWKKVLFSHLQKQNASHATIAPFQKRNVQHLRIFQENRKFVPLLEAFSNY